MSPVVRCDDNHNADDGVVKKSSYLTPWTNLIQKVQSNGGASSSGKNKTTEWIIDLLRSKSVDWADDVSDYSDEMKVPKSASTLTGAEIKELVMGTRDALRFVLACLATNDDDVDKVQDFLVQKETWHRYLLTPLSCQRGDPKCRVLASKLLCNLVTQNPATSILVASTIPLSPSTEVISTRMLKEMTVNELQWSHEVNDDDDYYYLYSDTTRRTDHEITWVDMILSAAKSGNREALGGIVATLHNSLAALPDNSDIDIELDDEYEWNPRTKLVSQLSFGKRLASDCMLISTLLRHIVPAKMIDIANQHTAASTSKDTDGMVGSLSLSSWDTATEWIQLLLARLARLGQLPNMFRAVSGRRSSEASMKSLLPEQIVLLHIVAREADCYIEEFASSSSKVDCRVQNHPLGGASDTGIVFVLASYDFLAGVVSALSQVFPRLFTFESGQSVGSLEHGNEVNMELMQSGLAMILDIVATTLGVDSEISTQARAYLGEKTCLLQDVAKYIGFAVDDMAQQSNGRRARDISMNSNKQRLLTGSVQLIGNVVYHCRLTQDLLRTTLVPQINGVGELETSKENEKAMEGPRNGLHVLLSCTACATSCFTLREWTVIAIRNILEENTENQAVVAELVALDPVQSANLEHLGLNIKLDSKGKVTLSPLEEETQEDALDTVVESTEKNVQKEDGDKEGTIIFYP